MNSEVMNVVFICDNYYAMPTAVAIVSLYENKAAESLYHIHIICCDVSQENTNRLQSLSRDGFTVSLISSHEHENYAHLKKNGLHVSTAALLKFSIADIFPQIDRILYLDSDILIQQDPAELFELNLTNYYAAAVKDMKPNITDPTQLQKLNAPHSHSYFNSGVMMLNLTKLRSENIKERLIDYRINGKNFFMDQDAFNVCFNGKVIYLPFRFNHMISVIGTFSPMDIQEFYNTNTDDEEEMHNPYILHLCTKYKPWEYLNVPFADKWYEYYQKSPYTTELQRSVLRDGKEIFVQYELTDKQLLSKEGYHEIIVSLTTYPARINTVHLTIKSLLCQTLKADRIILWLAREQFPNGENDVPPGLLSLCDKGLTICWCDDLRPHKKYYYTMEKYPQSIVITVDDDMEYQDTLIETLYKSYKLFPFAVSCMRAHEITFTNEGSVAPYSQWNRVRSCFLQPSMTLIATGVGGVLYPPHCMSQELFNIDRIKALCLNADDLWLKTMEVMALTPTVIAGAMQEKKPIDGTQDTALWKKNDSGNENDRQFKAILDVYNTYFGEKDTLLSRMKSTSLDNMTNYISGAKASAKIASLESQVRYLSDEINKTRISITYRVGSFITYIPKQIRNLLRKYVKNIRSSK